MKAKTKHYEITTRGLTFSFETARRFAVLKIRQYEVRGLRPTGSVVTVTDDREKAERFARRAATWGAGDGYLGTVVDLGSSLTCGREVYADYGPFGVSRAALALGQVIVRHDDRGIEEFAVIAVSKDGAITVEADPHAAGGKGKRTVLPADTTVWPAPLPGKPQPFGWSELGRSLPAHVERKSVPFFDDAHRCARCEKPGHLCGCEPNGVFA